MSLRRVGILIGILILLMGGVFNASAQSGGNLRIAIATPKTLDPALISNDGEILFNRSIYDYLVDVLPDRTIAPNLATAWTVSDDGLTYTLTLADGVKFHDGSDFSSADVVFTFNRLKDQKSPAINLLGHFEVSAPDAKTVVFTLPQANADFVYGLGDARALVLKDGTTDPNTLGTGDNAYASFNGTGPFTVTEYKEGESATLTKNANYWKNGQPLLDTVKFVFIDDPVTQVNALKSGDVDFIYKVTSDQLSTIKDDTSINIIQKATNQHPVIRLRTDEGPGMDVKVRQAFKYATDREQANDLVMDGTGIIGNNDPIGPGYGAFFDSAIQNPTYDPQKSCDLLKEAGYADGLSGITLQTINVLGYDTLATVLQQQWEPACIKVDINVNEESVYYDDNNPNNWLKADLGITGWGDRPVPQGYLSSAYASDGIYNETHWSDPDLDSLIKQAAVTSDQTARADIYHQISQIFADSGPIIIPWFAPIYGAAKNTVRGLDMAPFPGLTDLRGVSIGS